MSHTSNGAYGAEDDIVHYILGITYEIWEERGLDLIGRYYTPRTTVYSLDGIVRGSKAMTDGTRAMLEAFPDRLLVPDDVIWSRDDGGEFYTSHRIFSPMTNLGDSVYGAATGRQVSILTVADCVVEDGVITREWLMRDNHALIRQLGFDPVEAARGVAERRNDEGNAWLQSEIERLGKSGIRDTGRAQLTPANMTEFAEGILAGLWSDGNPERLDRLYAPYAVLRRSTIELLSGRSNILQHYRSLRDAFAIDGLSIDHIAEQPFGSNGKQVAVRWSATGVHRGTYLGLERSDRPVYILGTTHWRIVDGRIVNEWTIFDGLGVLSQLV